MQDCLTELIRNIFAFEDKQTQDLGSPNAKSDLVLILTGMWWLPDFFGYSLCDDPHPSPGRAFSKIQPPFPRKPVYAVI